jgi:hypothetical protein
MNEPQGTAPKRPVSERQKKYEDGCREISNDLLKQISRLPLPQRLLAMGNISDLFDCIRTAYTNGRCDEAEGVTR